MTHSECRPWQLCLCFWILLTSLLRPTFASHGIRQRNSSVPLRQVVEKSKSFSTALFWVANNGSAPSLPAPVGRHALQADECPHCDAHKCSQKIQTGPGICVVLRDVEATVGTPSLWERCIPSRKELNKLLRHRSLPSAQNGQSSGCRQQASKDEEEGAQKQEQQRICWCQAPSSLFMAAEEASSKERQALHARRRKNHHSQQSQAIEGNTGLATSAAAHSSPGHFCWLLLTLAAALMALTFV